MYVEGRSLILVNTPNWAYREVRTDRTLCRRGSTVPDRTGAAVPHSLPEHSWKEPLVLGLPQLGTRIRALALGAVASITLLQSVTTFAAPSTSPRLTYAAAVASQARLAMERLERDFYDQRLR